MRSHKKNVRGQSAAKYQMNNSDYYKALKKPLLHQDNATIHKSMKTMVKLNHSRFARSGLYPASTCSWFSKSSLLDRNCAWVMSLQHVSILKVTMSKKKVEFDKTKVFLLICLKTTLCLNAVAATVILFFSQSQ